MIKEYFKKIFRFLNKMLDEYCEYDREMRELKKKIQQRQPLHTELNNQHNRK